MAITNISTGLTDFNPGYNPLTYVFDSDNKTNVGFRYVVDIYEQGTSNKIYEGRVTPRPNDGYGYIDISKVISNFVTCDLDVDSTTNINATHSYYQYDINIGEEFLDTWEFDDTFQYTGNRIRISSTASHSYIDGDQITVSQDDPSFIPILEGLQTVWEVIDVNNIVVDKDFESSAPNTGSTKYANNKKTVFRDLLEIEATVFNGVFDSYDWIDYDSSVYKIQAASTTNLMLTNLPDNFYATDTQDLFVDVALTESSDAITFRFQNDATDIFDKTTNTNGTYIKQYACGPNNSAGAIIDSNTIYYDFWIVDDGGQQMTKKYRVYIDRRCEIEGYEILFKDRLGSYMSFAFHGRMDNNYNIKKTSYREQIGDIPSDKWTYERTDRGNKVTNVTVDKVYSLNSYSMTWEMANYYVELLSSPDTYIKIDGVYHSCDILANNYTLPSINNKRNKIRQRLTVRLSNQNNVNV